MPDYDPKSIPILDDIIEGESENADAAETSDKKIISEGISTGITGTENIQDDDTPDLFIDEASGIEGGAVEPEISVIDKFIGGVKDDSEEIEAENSETETVESALIDYQAETDITQGDEHTIDDPSTQHQTTADQSVASEPSITLDSIVDDVLKKLIPDLEQQLRFLVQQALEEKLPAEIINKISTKNDE